MYSTDLKFDAGQSNMQNLVRMKALNTVSGGKGGEWEMRLAPPVRNADGSSSDGQAYLFNKTTAQVLPVGATSQGMPPINERGIYAPTTKAEYDALPKGSRYMKDGVEKAKG